MKIMFTFLYQESSNPDIFIFSRLNHYNIPYTNYLSTCIKKYKENVVYFFQWRLYLIYCVFELKHDAL